MAADGLAINQSTSLQEGDASREFSFAAIPVLRSELGAVQQRCVARQHAVDSVALRRAKVLIHVLHVRGRKGGAHRLCFGVGGSGSLPTMRSSRRKLIGAPPCLIFRLLRVSGPIRRNSSMPVRIQKVSQFE